MIDKIDKKSKEISELIHKKINRNENIDLYHLAIDLSLGKLDYKDTVLILGLNPSSADIDKSGVANNCFLHYVPDSWIQVKDKKIVEVLAKKGFTYNKYFKKPYELFLKYDYRPVWTNKKYLNLKKNNLSLAEFNLLNNISDNDKYAVFSDLLQYKEKTAKKIEKVIMQDKILASKIIELFKLQIEFYNAKFVFINNAFASRLISKLIINKLGLEEKVYTTLDFNGTKIIFSAILTGGRAMDNYSFERLKKEISAIMALRS